MLSGILINLKVSLFCVPKRDYTMRVTGLHAACNEVTHRL